MNAEGSAPKTIIVETSAIYIMRLAVRGIMRSTFVGLLSAPDFSSAAKSAAAPMSATSEWVADGGMAVRLWNENILIP